MACTYCASIPLGFFLELTEGQHEFHPTLSSLRTSAKSGCHTCTLFYSTVIWSIHHFNHFTPSNDDFIFFEDELWKEHPVVICRQRKRLDGNIPLQICCWRAIADVQFVLNGPNNGKAKRLIDYETVSANWP